MHSKSLGAVPVSVSFPEDEVLTDVVPHFSEQVLYIQVPVEFLHGAHQEAQPDAARLRGPVYLSNGKVPVSTSAILVTVK